MNMMVKSKNNQNFLGREIEFLLKYGNKAALLSFVFEAAFSWSGRVAF